MYSISKQNGTISNNSITTKNMKQSCLAHCQIKNGMEIKNKNIEIPLKEPLKLFPIFAKQNTEKSLLTNLVPNKSKRSDTHSCINKTKVDKSLNHNLHNKKIAFSRMENQSTDPEFNCYISNSAKSTKECNVFYPNPRRSQRIKGKVDCDNKKNIIGTGCLDLPFTNKRRIVDDVRLEGLISKPRTSPFKKRKINASKPNGKVNRKTKQRCIINSYDEHSSNSSKGLEYSCELVGSERVPTKPFVYDNKPDIFQRCKKHNKNKECQMGESAIMVISDSYNTSSFPEIQIENSLENLSTVVASAEIQSSLENVETFPYISHCQQSSESEYHFIDLPDEDCCVKMPVWEGLVGITNIKSITECHNSSNSNTCLIKCESGTTKSSQKKNSSDVMWTDYVQNLDVNHINKMCMDELNSWLTLWKARYKQSNISETSSSKYDLYDSEDSTDNEILNSIIVSGFSGCGKNNLINTVANNLGFTVLEVNASSCRSGRQINLHMKEAFQSYHVENNKHGEFSMNLSVSTDFAKKNIKSSKGCMNELNVKSINDMVVFKRTPKVIQTTCVSKHKSIGDFLKKNQNQVSIKQISTSTADVVEDSKPVKHANKKNPSISPVEDLKVLKEVASEIAQCKISNLTVILFDDVDVVLDDDEGFWYAVNEFLKTSKKPVIFTVGRNLNALLKNIDFDSKVLKLNLVTEDTVLKQVLSCCEQNTKLNNKINLQLLSKLNSNDVRKCILNAQFWTQENEKCSANLMNVSCLSENSCFLLQSVDFTTNSLRDLLFSDCHNLIYIIMHHHMLGIDLFYRNLYCIFNISLEKEVLNIGQCDNSFSLDVCDESSFNIRSDSCNKTDDIVPETYILGELEVLFLFFLEFSFSDALKGLYCMKKFKWKSNAERILNWSAGLPACVDEDWFIDDEIVAEIISLIPILYFKKQQRILKSLASINKQISSNLLLDCPTVSLSYDNSKNKKLNAILPAIPLIQHCNKRTLNLDYLSAIKIMSKSELQRKTKSDKRSGRFLHYFDSACFLINEAI